MDINFWSAVFTIIAGITSIISLFFLIKDRNQATNISKHQEQNKIIVPGYIKKQKEQKVKRKTLFILATLSIIVVILSVSFLLTPKFFPPKIPTSNKTPTSNIGGTLIPAVPSIP